MNLEIEKGELFSLLGVNGAGKKADEIIEKFELTEIQKSKAKTLSGGWQRRISIAMALISEPRILFLDEPTLGLWNIIKRLKGKITIILTTHYLEEAEALSGRIAIMAKGKLKDIGTAKELMENTKTDNFEDVSICFT